MRRAIIIIVTAVLLLIGLSFLANRGGSESYDAKYFAPGPALGLVKGLSDDALEGRYIGTPGSIRAQEMIEGRMSSLELLSLAGGGYRQPFKALTQPPFEGMLAEEVSGVNLVGAVQGSAGSDKIIVVTAHYDHIGRHDGEIFNGADDNASGVSAALALAQHLSGAKNQPKHTFLFVIVDGEETGFIGANAFLKDTTLPESSLALNLNLDMVARADNGTLWASGPNHTPSLAPIIKEVAAETPLTVRIGYDGSDPEQDDWTELSDHEVFYRRGIPHLYLGVEDHPDYHQPTDDFENIDQDTFLKSVDTIIMIAKALDENLEDVLGLPPLPVSEE